MTNIKNIRGAEPTGGQSKAPGEAQNIVCTEAIYGGGNVISLDSSTAGQASPFNLAGTTNDKVILGITTKGSKNFATGSYDTGARIGYTREGVHDVCLADDNVAIAVGDTLSAELDSITYDGVSSAKIGAVDKQVPTTRNAASNIIGSAIASIFQEYSEIVGIALEAKTSSAGGYIKTLVCIPVLMTIPTS